MAGASRRVHNSIQFQFSDPLSKLATSRTTRYRIKKKRRCDMAIGEAGQQTTVNADCECAEHVEQNDKQEAYTTVTDEPFNVPENVVMLEQHDVMLEQHFVPILRDLPEEPEFLPNDYSNPSNFSECLADDELPRETEFIPGVCRDEQVDSLSSEPSESNVLLMQYIMRHNLTQEAISDLLKLLHIFMPKIDLPSSVYMFNKPFMAMNFPLEFHYFCNNCMQDISKDAQHCPKCKATLLSKGSRSTFVELPLELQLQNVLQSKTDVHACASYLCASKICIHAMCMNVLLISACIIMIYIAIVCIIIIMIIFLYRMLGRYTSDVSFPL